MEREKRVTKQIQSTVIDHTTGEVLTETNIETSKIPGNEPDYVKLYFDDLILLSGLPKSTSNIVVELVRYMTYSNEIILNSGIRKRICEALNIIPNTLTHALKNLCDADILERIEQNIYFVNPYLFGRGKWDDIKAMRLTCNYTSKGRKIRGYRNPPKEYDIFFEDENGCKNVLEDIVDEQVTKKIFELTKQDV